MVFQVSFIIAANIISNMDGHVGIFWADMLHRTFILGHICTNVLEFSRKPNIIDWNCDSSPSRRKCHTRVAGLNSGR